MPKIDSPDDPCKNCDEERVAALIRVLEEQTRILHKSLDDAYDELASLGFTNPGDLECARHRIEKKMEEVRMRTGTSWVADFGIESWYLGPDGLDGYWQELCRDDSFDSWEHSDFDALDSSSTKVVAHLGNPAVAGFRRKGLVLGYVQSGKTTNFTAVMAKAADAGYRFFIVLSGMHNSLRHQTQARLDRQLVMPNPEDWIPLTTTEEDPSRGDFTGAQPAAGLLGRNTQAKILCVIKKNKPRLCRLIQWLSDAPPEVLARCPTLIIDDEADQGSINTARPDNDPTVINGLIRDLIQLLPKVNYVAYTATPFANILINPQEEDDLYPRDFIVSLPKPTHHVGPETVFGREPLELDGDDETPDDGHDMIRIVPDEEADSLRPNRRELAQFSPSLTKSLEEAIHYFWLSTAARRFRDNGEWKHSTMLVHVSPSILMHGQFAQIIRQERERMLQMIKANDRSTYRSLRKLWDEESERVDAADFGHKRVEFDELLRELPATVEKTSIIIDNSMSNDRLDYSGGAATVIAVGGNTLSRGLTLEGLCVSYFIRNSNAYDTLLQMGRWFGYRRGYEDLPRIWMTEELRGWFRDMATVEQEIRYDIERLEFEGLTPLQLGVKIRTHPELSVTAASKMQSAVTANASFSGRRIQTRIFNHRDSEWLQKNHDATVKLLSDAQQQSQPAHLDEKGAWVLKNVSYEAVLTFLGEYQFHRLSRAIDGKLISDYIRSQVSNEELSEWTVAVIGRQRFSQELGEIDLGLPEKVNRIRRSQLIPATGQSHADIKALASPSDAIIDLPCSIADVTERFTRGGLGRARNAPEHPKYPGFGDGSALLAIYPISPTSAPRNVGNRTNLDAVGDVIGVSMVFPDAIRDEGAQTYVVADLQTDDLANIQTEVDTEIADDTSDIEEVEGLDNNAR